MASPRIVSTDPATAISQLWEGLPGEYVVTPRFHGEFSINDSIVSADDFVTPSLGRSKIISRPPSKAGYQSEFLETSTTTLVTKTGEEITMTERRIFRSRKDRGSVWAVAKDGQVTSLIADLYLTREISGPTGFRAFAVLRRRGASGVVGGRFGASASPSERGISHGRQSQVAGMSSTS